MLCVQSDSIFYDRQRIILLKHCSGFGCSLLYLSGGSGEYIGLSFHSRITSLYRVRYFQGIWTRPFTMSSCTFPLKCGYISEMWLQICPIRFVATFQLKSTKRCEWLCPYTLEVPRVLSMLPYIVLCGRIFV